jgi:hypothetical protein
MLRWNVVADEMSSFARPGNADISVAIHDIQVFSGMDMEDPHMTFTGMRVSGRETAASNEEALPCHRRTWRLLERVVALHAPNLALETQS